MEGYCIMTVQTVVKLFCLPDWSPPSTAPRFSRHLRLSFAFSLILQWNCFLWWRRFAATVRLFQDVSDIRGFVFCVRVTEMALERCALPCKHTHTDMRLLYSAWGWIALTSHLRSQTKLELPEQVYPAVPQDTSVFLRALRTEMITNI